MDAVRPYEERAVFQRLSQHRLPQLQQLSARGRYAVSLALLNGEINYSARLLDIAYQCTTCGNCDVTCQICRYNLQPLEMIRELRAKIVSDGQILPQHQPYLESLRNQDNMMLKPRAERGQWAVGLDVKRADKEQAEVLFHAGCRFSYDISLQAAVRAAVSLLSKAGVDIGILGAGEGCCGGRAYDMGYREEFKRCTQRNLEAWKKAGVKTIVTSCANCYYTFKRLYAALGSQFEILHTAEYLDRLIREGKIKPSRRIPLKVTYHDPCHLGRQGEPYVPWEGKDKKVFNQVVTYDPPRPRYNGAHGIYEPPRNVLKAIPGLQMVEMERNRESAWCCGAGGGVKEAYPDFSSWTAGERIEEAKCTGAEAIVSACGWCEKNFSEAINADSGKMKVFDIAELLQMAV
jgi:Fe-S oxidoreductase